MTRLGRARPYLEPVIAGVLALAVYLSVSYLLVYRLGFFFGDAMSRNNNARQILFSREPKLANMGFIWMPLPTLLQVPVVAVLPPAAQGFAGNLLTSLAGAGLCVVLLLLMRSQRVPGLLRWLVLAAVALQPSIVMYAASGMSEIPFLFFQLLSVGLYLIWRRNRWWITLAASGGAAALAMLCRVEGVTITAVLLGVVGLELFVKRRKWRITESGLLIAGLPVAYAGLLWMLANWLILGDPLYFLRGDTSNIFRMQYYLATKQWLLQAQANLPLTLAWSLNSLWVLSPAFILLSVLVVVAAAWRRQWVWLGLTLMAWSAFALTTLNLYRGQTELHWRYYLAAVPFSAVLAVGLWNMRPRRWRALTGAALVVILVVSAWIGTQSVLADTGRGEEGSALKALWTGQPSAGYQDEAAIGRYIDSQPSGLVLLDDISAYSVIYFTQHLNRLVTPSDSLFKIALREPAQHISYVLAKKPGGEPDAISKSYPDLYNQGAPWAELVSEAGPWRLYRMVGSPPLPATRLPVLGLVPWAQNLLIAVFVALSWTLLANLWRRRRANSLAGAG